MTDLRSAMTNCAGTFIGVKACRCELKSRAAKGTESLSSIGIACATGARLDGNRNNLADTSPPPTSPRHSIRSILN